MIDKLKLWTNDFEIDRSNGLKLRRADVNLAGEPEAVERVLFYYPDGEPVFGKKAYLNNRDLPYNLDIDSKGLFISLNPSIIYYGSHNFYTVTNYQLKMVMGWIKEDIRKQGIKLNLDNMDISRIDLCRNAEVKYPVSVYGKVFDWLKGKRMERINYLGSYSFRNKSREIVFYDKLKEVEEVYRVSRKSLGLPTNINIMRGELRLRNKRTVENNLDIVKVNELYNKEQYEDLKSRYRSILENVVFRAKGGEEHNTFSFQDEVEALRYFRSKYGRNSLYKYLSIQGIERTLEKIGGLENFKELLNSAGYSRRYIYKKVQEIERDLKSIQGFRREKDSFSELYEELYEKFVKVA